MKPSSVLIGLAVICGLFGVNAAALSLARDMYRDRASVVIVVLFLALVDLTCVALALRGLGL